MPTPQTNTGILKAIKMYNQDHGTAWDWGTNWSNVGTDFETFCFKYLFPKITETIAIEKKLGNRFDFLAREVDFIGQLSEEYTFKDIIPVSLNLSKPAELVLRRNYPQMMTKLYAQGEVKKNKLTFNNNDMRLNYATLGDGIKMALSAVTNLISGFNVTEEKEVKSMIVDYSLNKLQTANKRIVTDMSSLSTGIFTAVQNVQNNSEKYNEAMSASNGNLGRYTTRTKLEDLLILTTDDVKTYILDTKIANTFANAGLDLMNHICSFDDLGGAWRLDNDVTVTPVIRNFLRAFGDYQTDDGDILEKGTIFTMDISAVVGFAGQCTEIKPPSEFYSFVMDIRGIRYRRCTKGMVKEPFKNGDMDEVTHHFHYYSQKAISPFYNKILLSGV